jgi:hypothetical protein
MPKYSAVKLKNAFCICDIKLVFWRSSNYFFSVLSYDYEWIVCCSECDAFYLENKIWKFEMFIFLFLLSNLRICEDPKINLIKFLLGDQNEVKKTLLRVMSSLHISTTDLPKITTKFFLWLWLYNIKIETMVYYPNLSTVNANDRILMSRPKPKKYNFSCLNCLKFCFCFML